MQDLTVTLVQSVLYWEDPEANRAMLERKLGSIQQATDLVVLPEMFTTGFSMNAAILAEEMDGNSVVWMRKMADNLNAAVMGSLIIRENGRFYNRLIMVTPEGVLYQYDKRHLFTMANEEKIYTAGKKQLIVEWRGWKLCPLICYDLRFPVWSRNTMGYDLLIYVANWPEKRNFAWKNLLQSRAIENQCWTVGVNRVGKDGNGWLYSGDSSVFDPLGDKPHFTKENKEEIFIMKLSAKRLNTIQDKMPFLADRDRFEIAI